MSNYIGVRCPVCNKKFTEADDIVVCPICGAPHHRSCYAEQGACMFVDDHLSGKVWSDPAGQVPPEEENPGGKTCSRCGGKNAPDAIFCLTCGFPLTLPNRQAAETAAPGETPYQWGFPGGIGMQINTITMAYGGLNPEDEIDGENVKELAKYVGSGSAYYLPRFRMISEYGRAFMPNFSAFIFSFFYFFYRKMYALGVLLLAISAVSMIPRFIYMNEVGWPILIQQMLGATAAPEVTGAVAERYQWLANVDRIAQMILIFIALGFSFFANRVYYRKAIAAVHSIRSQRTESATDDEYYKALSRAGGTNKAAVIILASVMVIASSAFFVIKLSSLG